MGERGQESEPFIKADPSHIKMVMCSFHRSIKLNILSLLIWWEFFVSE